MNLSEFFTECDLSKEDARVFSIEHNAATRDKIRLKKNPSKLAPKAAFAENSLVENMSAINNPMLRLTRRRKLQIFLLELTVHNMMMSFMKIFSRSYCEIIVNQN